MCSEALYISAQLTVAILSYIKLLYLRCIKREVVFISQAFSIEMNFFCILHINLTTPVILNSAALHCLKCLC